MGAAPEPPVRSVTCASGVVDTHTSSLRSVRKCFASKAAAPSADSTPPTQRGVIVCRLSLFEPSRALRQGRAFSSASVKIFSPSP